MKVRAHYKTIEYDIVCAGCKKIVAIVCAHGKTNTRIYCDDCAEERNRTWQREAQRRKK